MKSTGLKGNSLMELMKLKPPPDIAPPVATATGPSKLFERAVTLMLEFLSLLELSNISSFTLLSSVNHFYSERLKHV